jgi:hypothetical protein
MDSKYDVFFALQPTVSFAGCIPGHIIELEGPQDAFAYTQISAASRLPVVGLSAGVSVLAGAMM